MHELERLRGEWQDERINLNKLLQQVEAKLSDARDVIDERDVTLQKTHEYIAQLQVITSCLFTENNNLIVLAACVLMFGFRR